MATLLGAIRADRGLSKAQVARQLGKSQPAISRFENGDSTSDQMLLDYMSLLDLDIREVEDLTDRLTGSLSATLYDKRKNPLERALIADRLTRVLTDGYSGRVRELVDGPCGTRTHVSAPSVPGDRRTKLTRVDGNPDAKPERTYQTHLPFPRAAKAK